jgi:hypothetical protein
MQTISNTLLGKDKGILIYQTNPSARILARAINGEITISGITNNCFIWLFISLP